VQAMMIKEALKIIATTLMHALHKVTTPQMTKGALSSLKTSLILAMSLAPDLDLDLALALALRMTLSLIQKTGKRSNGGSIGAMDHRQMIKSSATS